MKTHCLIACLLFVAFCSADLHARGRFRRRCCCQPAPTTCHYTIPAKAAPTTAADPASPSDQQEIRRGVDLGPDPGIRGGVRRESNP